MDRPAPSLISRRRLVQIAVVAVGGALTAPHLWTAEPPEPALPKAPARLAPRSRLPASAAGGELLIPLHSGSNPCHLGTEGARLTDVSVAWDASVRGTMVSITYKQTTPTGTAKRLRLKLLGDDLKPVAEEIFDLPRIEIGAPGPLGTTRAAYDTLRWGTRKIGPHSRTLSLAFID